MSRRRQVTSPMKSNITAAASTALRVSVNTRPANANAVKAGRDAARTRIFFYANFVEF